MNDLVINTKEHPLLSGTGILFPIDYPALRTTLDVALHLAGAMTYTVTDESRFAQADLSRLCSDVCSELSIAVSAAAERIGHPSRIPDHAGELSASVRDRLSKRWAEAYGALPGALAITGVSLLPDSQAMMERMDQAAAFAARPQEDRLSAMAETLLAAQQKAAASMPLLTGTWNCTCGTVNRGFYCTECGKGRVWACSCGTMNAGNFCTNCGKKRA